MKGEVRSLGGSKSISLGFRRDCLTVYLLCVWEKQGTRPGVSLLGGEWSEPAIFH